ncbi:MAG: hypothetical protein ABL998_07225 [Planctomycetota bacterium]
MKTTTRKIGLSLGADFCWPLCYEEIVKQLALDIRVEKEQLTFDVQRVQIDPFKLDQPSKYDLVIDRLTHWYQPSREWIKKAVILDGLYVFNNPWSVQSNEKHTTYAAMMRLGLPIPATWMVPPKSYEPKPDLEVTLARYAKLFDIAEAGKDLGYPLFMKPFDGGGWVGVNKIDDEAALRDAYEKSGKFLMHLQAGVYPFDSFVRCIGLGPQTTTVKYDPAKPLHQRYLEDRDFLADEDRELLEDMTLTINAFFGWDFNSCEALHKGGVWYPIDFANPCPDSQVTSLHVHFPWLVKAKIKWSLFCAATKKPFRPNLDWAPFFAIAAEKDMTPREKLAGYAAIARERFESERFEEFCEKHLAHLDEVAWEFFGTPRAREAVAGKVAALFPAHEHETFTEYFWQKLQDWRRADAAARQTAHA